MSDINYQTKQIIPAVGWTAIVEEEGSSTAHPLVCWADVICEANGKKFGDIVGMIADGNSIVPALTKSGFKRYDYDTDGAGLDYEALQHD
jgi:hypothetical protein